MFQLIAKGAREREDSGNRWVLIRVERNVSALDEDSEEYDSIIMDALDFIFKQTGAAFHETMVSVPGGYYQGTATVRRMNHRLLIAQRYGWDV